MERPMQKLNDLSRSLIPLELDCTLITVIEMSQSSWLVASIVPGVERQPLKKLTVDESALLKLLQRWRQEAEKAGHRNPQDRFEHTTRWSRFAPRTSIGNSLLRKMIPDAFPLLVREPNHSTFISDRQQAAILR